MPIRLNTSGFDSESQERDVSALMRGLFPYFPWWVHRVSVEYDPFGEKEDITDVVPNEEYRSACIRIFPRFFRCSPEEQRAALIHEVSHLLRRSHFWVQDRVIPLIRAENEQLGDFLLAEFESLMEGETEDLTRTLLRNEQDAAGPTKRTE
jgi:hypothetical protein